MRTTPLPFRSARAVPTEGLPPASDGVPKRSCAPQGFQRSVTEAMYDYFHGAEAEQFSFYRIPKVLFTEERFRSVSAEAKVLYGLLLDRMSLSCKNGWLDRAGRVYISAQSLPPFHLLDPFTYMTSQNAKSYKVFEIYFWFAPLFDLID